MVISFLFKTAHRIGNALAGPMVFRTGQNDRGLIRHAVRTCETPMTDTTQRNERLRQILNDRRRELKHDIDSRVRNGRARQDRDGHDAVEQADAGSQAEIEYAFIEMQAASLTRIDRALARLDAGEYGRCSECAGDIAEERLRALPFASRCRTCEQQREHEQGHLRQLAQVSSLALFSNATGS